MKPGGKYYQVCVRSSFVAFTPKGGCPLKRENNVVVFDHHDEGGSIHPQGWVPIETLAHGAWHNTPSTVAFTPKGGCPLKPHLS